MKVSKSTRNRRGIFFRLGSRVGVQRREVFPALGGLCVTDDGVERWFLKGIFFTRRIDLIPSVLSVPESPVGIPTAVVEEYAFLFL